MGVSTPLADMTIWTLVVAATPPLSMNSESTNIATSATTDGSSAVYSISMGVATIASTASPPRTSGRSTADLPHGYTVLLNSGAVASASSDTWPAVDHSLSSFAAWTLNAAFEKPRIASTAKPRPAPPAV